MVVNQYVCRCDCRYVGRTFQKLRTELINTFRHAQEATKDQRKICLIENAKSLAPLVSTVILQIEQHFLGNEERAEDYNDAQFSILARARSSLHLSILEAIYINSLPPILCRQKKFVYSLQNSR